jgi:broad specificity phosphatase PhoE
MDVTIVRHGRTSWNVAGRFQGHTDIPLDRRGRSQASALCRALASDAFDAAFSSDLLRAKETAERILRVHSAPLTLDARLREMRFGDWEGLTWSEIVERDPVAAERGANARGEFYVPTRGESFADLCVRVGEALNEILAVDYERVLVVTHAGPLHAIMKMAFEQPDDESLRIKFTPASVTRIRFEGERATLVSLNESVDSGAGALYP